MTKAAKATKADEIRVQVQTTIDTVVNPDWIEFITQYVDIFGHGYCGYWLRGDTRDDKLGWLVYERDAEDRYPNNEECVIARLLWRENKPLPENWHRLNTDACVKAWVEGVKKWGVEWYEDGDADTYDYVIQMALLGEVRYG